MQLIARVITGDTISRLFRKGLRPLFIIILIFSVSACGESEEEAAQRNQRADLWFESMVKAKFQRNLMRHHLTEVESLGAAYLGKTEVTYPDNSGAYLVYGLQKVSTESRGVGYIFLFCTINIGDLSDECSNSSTTFLPSEKYSIEAIRELVRKSNAMGFQKLEYLGGFGPN